MNEAIQEGMSDVPSPKSNGSMHGNGRQLPKRKRLEEEGEPHKVSSGSEGTARPELKESKRVRFQGTTTKGHPHPTGTDAATANDDDDEDLRQDTVNKRRSKGLRLDGYDSDETDASSSDSDKEDDVPTKDTEQPQQQEAEDEDMFGDSFEEPKSSRSNAGEKGKKTLESQDIEGQEWNAEQEYTEDGLKIEPFNMDKEMEEGYAASLFESLH